MCEVREQKVCKKLVISRHSPAHGNLNNNALRVEEGGWGVGGLVPTDYYFSGAAGAAILVRGRFLRTTTFLSPAG